MWPIDHPGMIGLYRFEMEFHVRHRICKFFESYWCKTFPPHKYKGSQLIEGTQFQSINLSLSIFTSLSLYRTLPNPSCFSSLVSLMIEGVLDGLVMLGQFGALGTPTKLVRLLCSNRSDRCAQAVRLVVTPWFSQGNKTLENYLYK
jgi:hypothetical protein